MVEQKKEVAPDLVDRFTKLFTGLDRAYGRYIIDENVLASDTEKKQGRGETTRADVLPEMYEAHLNGNAMLGIVPIQDGNKCQFSAIDIDDYKLDIPKLIGTIKKNKLPVVPTRSKSGGIHLYAFSVVPLPAATVKAKLEEIATKLGFPGVEVFPKQKTITKEGVGNWINLPWFDAHNTDRFGWNVETGEEIHELSDWLEYAEGHMLTLDDFTRVQVRNIEPQAQDENRLITDGPPCLQRILERGVNEGERNNTGFNLVVYLRNKHAIPTDEQVEDGPTYDNSAMMEELYTLIRETFKPPLDDKEINQILENVERNVDAIRYTCAQPPLVGNCNRGVCQRRSFGIGLTGRSHDYEDLWHMIPMSAGQKELWDESSWVLLLKADDKEYLLELTSEQLVKHSAIRMHAMRRGLWVPPVDADEWANIIQDKMNRANRVTLPEEISVIGELRALIIMFFESYAHDTEKKQLLSGQAYHSREDSQFWTPKSLLTTYLKAERFPLTGTMLHRALTTHFGMKAARHRVSPTKSNALHLWVFPDDLSLVNTSGEGEEDEAEI